MSTQQAAETIREIMGDWPDKCELMVELLYDLWAIDEDAERAFDSVSQLMCEWINEPYEG